MAANLVAHEQSLLKVFSRDYVFSIPSYQRPYAWTKDQARDLYEDLVGSMQSQADDITNLPPYFLGSIVLIKSSDEPQSEVVDGQQRLTTLTLLLSALRANMPPSQAAEVTQFLYEKGMKIGGTKDHFRLILRELDREFFRIHVQLEGGFNKLISLDKDLPDAQKRIRENAVFFNDCLQSLSEDERERLAAFVMTRCFLVVVSTPDPESAFRIFSVLNSRGLDLSATDILKAEILSKLPNDQLVAYTNKWEAAEQDLGRDDFLSLFSHIRMIYRKIKPQGTLLSEFRDSVSRNANPAKLLDEVVFPMAEVFDEIINADYTSQEHSDKINESLRWLGRLEFSDWIPPAIAFCVKNRNRSSSVRSFIIDLERLSYSMLIRRAATYERIERFSRLTKAIEEEVDLAALISPLQLTSSEQLQVLKALEGPVYAEMSARTCSLLLTRLDALVGAEGVTHSYPVISVEHVLPRNPAQKSVWMTWFPDQQQREEWTDRLGNLTLLSRRKNSAAQNYDFDRKKIAYFIKDGVAPFSITTQVLQHATWELHIIVARQKDLVGRLAEHWRLR